MQVHDLGSAPSRRAHAEPVSVVREYYERVDANDVAGTVSLFSPDAVYWRPGYSPIAGRQALTEFYRATRVISSGRHKLSWVLRDDQRVAVMGRFAGRLKSGDAVEVGFADFFQVEGASIVERHTLFEVPAV